MIHCDIVTLLGDNNNNDNNNNEHLVEQQQDAPSQIISSIKCVVCKKNKIATITNLCIINTLILPPYNL